MIIKLDIIHVSSFMGPQLVVLIYVHTVQGYMDLGGDRLARGDYCRLLMLPLQTILDPRTRPCTV